MSNVSDNENKIYHAEKDILIALVDINKAISVKSYNKQTMSSNLIIPSEVHKDNVKANRDEIKHLIINDEINNIYRGNDKISEGNVSNIDDDEGDSKVVHNIESGNKYLIRDEINLNDSVGILKECNI